jgi:hypothetical protein
MRRRATLFAATLVMVTGFALAGAGPTSAATPLRIKPGSVWTAISADAVCQVVTFRSGGVFTSQNGPSGTWSGGRKSLTMTWPGSPGQDLTFKGTFTKVPLKEYSGVFEDMFPGQVEKGTANKC